MTTLSLQIDGMSCGHCVHAVRKALTAIDGVTVDDVAIGSATVQYDAARTTPAAIAGAITDAGYTAQPATR